MDTEKATKILRDQIEKMSVKKFDLNAWKTTTIILLERIFGQHNEKIDGIRAINYDQGSWTLRDETGFSHSVETCKKMGREILEAAIIELEAFGAVEGSIETLPFNVLLTALEDELTGSELREIKKVLTEKSTIENKKQILITKLKSYSSDAAYAIVANILSNPETTGLFNQPK
ncbi:MAG: hypothetical protein ISS19_19365 [Bacteroidales bacterium]|nr:hypothetical protein [Bacteroidales bacterium]